MKKKKRSLNSMIIGGITVLIVALTAIMVAYFIIYTNRFGKTVENTAYDRYYVMITDNGDSSFWRSVYESGSAAAAADGDYLEMIADNLSRDYTRDELMEIAIDSGVDGIIVAADESDEMTRLINKACSHGIGVVTLYTDNTASDRLSYVGVSNYNLGKLYGELLLRLAGERERKSGSIDAVILVEANSSDTGQNVILSAVQETLDNENETDRASHPEIELSVYTVDASGEFSVEESIKGLLLRERDRLPDVVVCLSEKDTVAVYQTVVDYNEVGLVDILGYYDSEVILNGINRNVIYATISADTSQMGEYSIGALNEYFDYGYTNQYFTADISIITRDNISEYLEGGNP